MAAVAAPAAGAAGTPSLREQLETQAARVVNAGVPGVVVEVVDRGRTIRVAAGRADLRRGTRMRAAARFRVGSLAKTYVATAVLQLAGEGRIGLDDSVERWVPGLVPRGSEITVRHLLGHRSGLFDYLDDSRTFAPYLKGKFNHQYTPRELVGIATEHPAVFTPGASVHYSNTDYTVLGLVVEAATNKPLSSVLRERIFAPLRLRSTSLPRSAQLTPPYARGYLIDGGRRTDVTAVSPTSYWGAGNLVSTADDVARFYGALFGGRLVTPQQLSLMTTMVRAHHQPPTGLGLQGGSFGSQPYVGHDGAVPGYDAVALRMTRTGRRVVALANSVTFSDKVGSPAAQRAWARLVRIAATG